jgi:hypothetical protein
MLIVVERMRRMDTEYLVEHMVGLMVGEGI